MIYHPSLTVNITLKEILSSNIEIDYLLVEGAISSNERFFSLSNLSTNSLINKLIKKTKYLIAVGSCASNGGIHAKI